MDQGHYFGDAHLFLGGGKEAGGGTPLTSPLVRELIASPEAPADLLRAALQESHRRFEQLLSCISGTFYRCELTPPWRMEFISTGIEAITGYDPGFFTRTPYGDIVEPEDMPALQQAVSEAVDRREQFSVRYRLRHKSGEVRWVSERGAAIYDEHGRPQFLEGFITDITVTRELELRAEAARRDAEALNDKLSHIFDSMLDCVMSYDKDWNLTFANRRAREEIAGNGYGDISENLRAFSPAYGTPFWDVFEHVMAKREPRRTEGYMPDIQVWYDLYAVPDGEGITVFFRNVCDRKKLESVLLGQADDFERTLDTIPVMVWTTHVDGTGDYYNQSWNDFIGRSSEEARSDAKVATSEWIHPDDRDYAFDTWGKALAIGDPFEMEIRLRHNSGGYRWVLARVWPFRDGSGTILKWYGAATDIHERILADRRLKESLRLQESLLNSSGDHIKVMDLDGRILMLNETANWDVPIYDPDNLVNKLWTDLWPQKDRRMIRNAIRKAGKGKAVRFTCCSPSRGNLPLRWWDIMLTPVADDLGQITYLLCISRDVTQLKATTERLRVVSEQDFLTALPNRAAFERQLKRMTTRARERANRVGLMLIDLDHFKHVNDSLGHLAGDHLLRTVARRLQAAITGNGFVARLGGDEFAVVLDDIADDMDMIGVAGRILSSMERPVTYQGKHISGGLSIGCAVFPRDAADTHSLLKHADAALYDLKASGRGGLQMFNSKMKEAAERTVTQLNLARQVIQEDTVEAWYQPKVWLGTGKVAGFEALLRWWCPAGGIQLPGTVAEAFNDYELSTKIGGLMQARVLGDLAQWLGNGLDVLPVSINASPAEFLRDDYAERLLRRIADFGVAPSLIEVEITEHAFLERGSEHVIRALLLLKDAGVRIALDDFGTGHSSLAHLRDFPVDVIKIDRSFVNGLLGKKSMLAIVQAIAKLGPSLAIDIVAEGVETRDQLALLRDAGCAMGQGYLFGKAMSPREATEWLSAPPSLRKAC